MAIHLVIHGHFYQPPRENPWTGRIERQVSAAPFHDWNARITDECYRPNASSRVLDEKGHIQDIVNNFERISFNVGPTLLSWLAEEAPDVVAALEAGDRNSRARLGHGSAIAQAYNHVILPLATPRDRQTQIRWGVREFQHRFARPPEAMWLPEAAVDALTLEMLVRAGMRYLILSPAQAARWRPLGDGPWLTSAEAELDPRVPYRWRLRDDQGRPQGDLGIDICFYHAALSRGISFQHYLRDASLLASRIADAAAGASDPLILIATDGESFGHHEKFGDMCLATLFAREAPRRGFEATNLAAFLESHRPAREVELFPESAWSCSHGVGRWSSDCGCSTGGGAGWTQAWRRPLRQGLDRLRESLAAIFQEEGSLLLRDPWEARDDYIDILLDGGQAAREAFFARHQGRVLDADLRGRALRLLEMQHQAMLMYTSCAWFFSDVSGIETVQNLRYAFRAIELAAPFAPLDLEAVLLDDLARAKSNLEKHRDGRHLWERQVRPSQLLPEHAAARLLVEGLLGREPVPQERYRWWLTPDPIHQGDGLLLAGISAVSELTGEHVRLAGACRFDGPFDFLAAIAPGPAPDAWASFAEEARLALRPGGSDLTAWVGRHAARLLRLRHFLPDERQAILTELLAPTWTNLERARDLFCAEAGSPAEAMVEAGIVLPSWLKTLLEASWSRALAERLEKLEGIADPARYGEAVEVVAQARHLGLTLELDLASASFARILRGRLDAIAASNRPGEWQEFLEFLQLGARLGLPLPERALQDRMFALLRSVVPALVDRLRDPSEEGYSLARAMLAVASRLNLRTDEIHARLRPLEEGLAKDPNYWP